MSASGSLRTLARTLLPAKVRRFLRRAAREAPVRLRDLPRDAVCVVAPRAFGGPLPSARLRGRVGLPSRREFTLVGEEGARQILAAFARAKTPGRDYPSWLDFGCGCGRIARHLAESPEVRALSGVDVDALQIAWAARHLPGRYSVMRSDPPLPFQAASFDVVCAISIFTHFSEAQQFAWLEEMRRLLKPGGLLIATTHAPEIAAVSAGLTAAELDGLAEKGFLAVDRGGTFNERSTFHSLDYLRREWGRAWRFHLHESRGFVGYQDLSVWEKAAD